MKIDNVIEIEKINRYGTQFLHPRNEQAKKACLLIGDQKTLTPTNCEHLKEMGFTIKQVIIAGDKKIVVGEL